MKRNGKIKRIKVGEYIIFRNQDGSKNIIFFKDNLYGKKFYRVNSKIRQVYEQQKSEENSHNIRYSRYIEHQDLLPNYIDGLTNEETNLFIENHLKECSVCKKTFENMKQELDITKPSRNSKEVKYLKKFNKKLLILRVLVFILLLVALSVMTYHYNTMKNAYFKASNIMVDMVKEGMYPDTFYATIEEISDPGVYGLKEIKVKGLNINDRNHRDEYNFTIPLDNIGDNFKLKWNNTNINFEQLKVGPKVAIYNYGEILDNGNLRSVRMIVVLDDTL